MEYLDRPFEVTRGSGRRPTPTTFEHLRKYSALELAYLKLSSQVDITNINSILEQTANLYVSNEIHRVIAQVIGKFDPGFVTIEGTEDGALHVHLVNPLTELDVNATLEPGANLIGQVQIQGTSQTVRQAVISKSGADSTEIVAAVTNKKICIVNIVFTVGGEINLTFQSAGNAISGAMDFGGENEPRGLVSNNGNFPLKTLAGEAFNILRSTTEQLSGYVTYYQE